MSRCYRLLPLAVLLVAAAAAQSQTAAPLPWGAPLEGYQPFTDQKVTSWKDANDTVGRIGGWREYARESQQQGDPKPAPAVPVAPATGHGDGPRRPSEPPSKSR